MKGFFGKIFRNRKNTPKKKICANCSGPYREGDKYCRYCGAPMGKPKVIDDDFACIYGPPPAKRTHVCSKCGNTWETSLMIDNEEYCPVCGGPAPVTKSSAKWD